VRERESIIFKYTLLCCVTHKRTHYHPVIAAEPSCGALTPANDPPKLPSWAANLSETFANTGTADFSKKVGSTNLPIGVRTALTITG
jgi:hypothetical protein